MQEIVSHVIANYAYIIIAFSYYISFMLYDFMQDGMIFGFYGKWLKKEETYNKFVDAHNSKEDTTILLDYVEVPFWKKPLGLCLKCFHVWIALIIAIIFLENINYLLLIVTISFSYHKLVQNYYN